MKNLLINFIIVLVLGTTITTTTAQNQRSTGLVWDDDGYRQTPHLPRYEGRKYNEVPLTHSLVKYAPSVRDQGTDGTCVPHAVAYGALTIENAIQQKITDQTRIDEMAFSVDYVFNQIKVKSCQEGSRITDALALLKEEGDTPISSFDVDDCFKMPTKTHREEAMRHRIKDYAALFSYAVAPEVKIDKVRKTIAANHPVPVGMRITTSFFMVKPGQELWSPKADELVIGGHAMLVVGYDEVDKSFLLMNSWGKNWGKDGFIKVKYDDFARQCKYAFQMVLRTNEIIVNTDDPKEEKIEEYVNLSGDFIFRYPTGYTNDAKGNQVIAFEEAAAEYDTARGVHTLARKDWKVEQVFQLVAKNIPVGKNVYVFSIDANKKAELHWPAFDEQEQKDVVVTPPLLRDESEQDVDAYNKIKIAPFIPSSDAEIVIPSADEALQLAVKGEDNLVILYSEEVIEDIDARIEQVRTTSGEFKAAFDLAFGDLLMPSDDVTYAPYAMSFEGKTQLGNPTVVPIILSVVAH